MTDAFMAAQPIVDDFARNGRGQPMIVPPNGGPPVAYNRPSSWGKKIEDMYGVNQWEKRCIVAGIARTPSLIARALAIPMDPRDWVKADKDQLNGIADEAKTAARGNQASEIGTALHRMTERVDNGDDLGELPEPFASDIAAYRDGMRAYGLQTLPRWTECRMVCDDLQLAGTADRIVADGATWRIFDLKTGESIELAALGYAVQLAIYAHSQLYDVATGERTVVNADWRTALIGHLPAGKGEFAIHEVDIEAGWEAALCAREIDRWRKRKGLMVPRPTAARSSVGVAREHDAAPAADNGGSSTLGDPPTFELPPNITNLRERCKAVAERDPKIGAQLRFELVSHNLDLRQRLTDPQVHHVERVLRLAEKAVSAPFIDLPTRGAIDEGAMLHGGERIVVDMIAAYRALDDEARRWIDDVVTESKHVGRSLHLGAGFTMRKVRLMTGLVAIAAHVGPDVGVVRALVAMAVEGTMPPPGPLGDIVSALTVTQSATFAVVCMAFANGELESTFTDDGVMLLRFAA